MKPNIFARLLSAFLVFSSSISAAEVPTSIEPTADKDGTIKLSAFEVNSSQDKGYIATNAISGTRFAMDLIDLPKPVDVITSEFMVDIGAIQLADALQYVAGVAQIDANGPDNGVGGGVAVRGFSTTTTYRNGYRAFGVADNLFTDRIEVIRGPSSVFSGTIEPGGTINIITARPPTRPGGSVTFRAGSYGKQRTELRVGGPLNRSGTLGILLAGAYEDYGYSWDFAHRNRPIYGGHLAWQVAPRTKVSLDVQFVDSKSVVFREAALLNPAATELLKDYNHDFNRAGPRGFDRRTQGSAVAEAIHEFNRSWSVRFGTYWRYQDAYGVTAGGSSRILVDAKTGARTVDRDPTITSALGYVYVPQASVLGSLGYAGISHRVMLMADYQYTHDFNEQRKLPAGVTLPRIDIDNPTDYDLRNPDQYTRRTTSTRTASIQRGFSFNNVWQAYDNRLTIMQGFRRGAFYSVNTNRLPNPATSTAQVARDTDTMSAGASFRFFKGVNAYISYGESYLPQTGRDYSGNLFEAITGKGWDYGLKFNLVDRFLSGSITGFNLDRGNVPQPDPDHPGFQVQSGLDHARGAELSVNGKVTSAWQVVTSVARVDARVVKDPSRPQNIGLRNSGIPKYQGSIWNRYAFSSRALKGLGVGVGVLYAGERRGNPNLADLRALRSPAYTRVDTNVTYSKRLLGRSVNLSLAITNLLNAEYMPAYTNYGDPRNLMGSVSYKF